MALHDPFPAGRARHFRPEVGHVITADATQDLRVTQAEFDRQNAIVEAAMRRDHGAAGAAAARGIAAAFQRMMVRS